MGKKRSGSSVRGQHPGKKGRITPDSKIDFSDIPEYSNEELSRTRPVGRPKLQNPKKLMAIRMAPDLIYQLRKLAKRKKKPYQTLLHELLEKAVRNAA